MCRSWFCHAAPYALFVCRLNSMQETFRDVARAIQALGRRILRGLCCAGGGTTEEPLLGESRGRGKGQLSSRRYTNRKRTYFTHEETPSQNPFDDALADSQQTERGSEGTTETLPLSMTASNEGMLRRDMAATPPHVNVGRTTSRKGYVSFGGAPAYF
jgi:hypothetical protein